MVQIIKRRVHPRRLQTILWDAIEKNRVRDKDHVRSFLADGRIEEIIRMESAEQKLSRSHRPRTQSWMRRLWKIGRDAKTDPSPKARPRLAEQICGELEHSSATKQLENFKSETTTRLKTFRKILAILTLIDLSNRISSFVERGVCDQDLPLRFEMSGIQPSMCWQIFRLSNSKIPLGDFPDSERSTDSISKFEERQWSMLAPSFAHGTKKTFAIRHFSKDVILPFTSCKSFEQSKGSSCQLFKVDIHPDHHDFQKFGVSMLRVHINGLSPISTNTAHSNLRVQFSLLSSN